MTDKKTENKSPVLEELRKLNLPEGSFMVMGSGILDALGIRGAKDVDLVVSQDLYAQLKEDGWKDRVASTGAKGIEYGIFQAYDRWTDEEKVKSLDELLEDAEWIDGVAYNSLAKLVYYKRRRGREKDLADLKLIESYLESN